jgi:hypothetical protein
MTWVVGAVAPFGYGIGISDIRVTLANRMELDCLQKIYPVGRFLALGFAGSVAIGFAMVDKLTELLYSADESRAWDPTVVANWWRSDARQVFQQFPSIERDSHSHLILIGTHPTQNNGDSDWPTAYVYTFRSPDFEPLRSGAGEVVAIGSGNFEPMCREAVHRISSDHEARFNIWKGEQGVSGGMGTMLGWQLTMILKETQPQGISSHLHYCWVYRGRIVVRTNNHATIGAWSTFDAGPDAPERVTEAIDAGRQDSSGIESFIMPTIAKSWRELENLLHGRGASAVGATT